MDATCTIYFEDPFWVGIFERSDANGYAVARFVFGAEPTEAQLLRFAKECGRELRFSTAQAAPPTEPRPIGFKRRLRDARKQVEQSGAGTYAQRALQVERELGKQERRERKSADRQKREDEKFRLKQQVRKEKHRGH